VEGDSSETSIVKKKVISTEKFPNNPAVNYTYGFFNKVKKNSPLAQAHAEKQKKKDNSTTDTHSK
jgi:hypothetical protein